MPDTRTSRDEPADPVADVTCAFSPWGRTRLCSSTANVSFALTRAPQACVTISMNERCNDALAASPQARWRGVRCRSPHASIVGRRRSEGDVRDANEDSVPHDRRPCCGGAVRGGIGGRLDAVRLRRDAQRQQHGRDNADAANVDQIQRRYQATLPASVDSAPVYLSNVSTSGGTKDLLFLLGTNGTLMAVDAADGRCLVHQATDRTADDVGAGDRSRPRSTSMRTVSTASCTNITSATATKSRAAAGPSSSR